MFIVWSGSNTKTMKEKDFTMKPPLFADKRIADLESDLIFAKTAPYYIPTMRPGDMAYQMTERMLNRIKREVFIHKSY